MEILTVSTMNNSNILPFKSSGINLYVFIKEVIKTLWSTTSDYLNGMPDAYEKIKTF